MAILLFMLAGESKSCSAELVRTLLLRGTHFDELNNARQSFDSLSKEPMRHFVNPMPYLTLKCLAARVVSKYNIRGHVPAELVSFIEHH